MLLIVSSQAPQPAFQLDLAEARACVTAALGGSPEARVTFLSSSGIKLARHEGAVLLSLPHGQLGAELRLLHVQRCVYGAGLPAVAAAAAAAAMQTILPTAFLWTSAAAVLVNMAQPALYITDCPLFAGRFHRQPQRHSWIPWHLCLCAA